MEKQRADDRKWLVDNARRIDSLEAQVREQTRESMDYARTKWHEVDSQLRAELAAGVHGLVKDLDQKMASEMPGLVQAVETRCRCCWPPTRRS